VGTRGDTFGRSVALIEDGTVLAVNEPFEYVLTLQKIGTPILAPIPNDLPTASDSITPASMPTARCTGFVSYLGCCFEGYGMDILFNNEPSRVQVRFQNFALKLVPTV
jgi:hypothetical protein